MGEQKKKNSCWSELIKILAAAGLLIVCAIIGFSLLVSTSTQYTVTYEVTGSGPGITASYTNAQGGTEQGDYSLPFQKSFNMKSGSNAVLVAQNKGSGSITCHILMNGDPWRESTSTGSYAVVTCEGIVGSN